MPKLKKFNSIQRFLIAVGTPPLFALKILLWTVIWLGNSSLTAGKNIFHIGQGVLETFSWLGQTIFASILILAKSIPVPKISLPKIKFPKRLVIRPKKQKINLTWKLRYLVTGFIIFFILVFIPYWLKSQLDRLPDPHLLTVRDIPVSTKIYDRNGILLYQIYSDENRIIVDLKDLPKNIVNATIAIEDKNFYSHLGIDPAGIVRAALANFQNGGTDQGGSTITQQLVKSALLSPQRTISRKLKEIVLALWAERLYSKDQILTMYLNQVPYGSAAYGIEAAAQTYFGKSARDLSLSEAALLAGLPSAPTIYSPFGSHPELTKQRQTQVLDAMVNQGFITRDQQLAASNQPLEFVPVGTEIKAPHFVMYVKDYLVSKYGIKKVERGGLSVITSLDYNLYQEVSGFVHDGVAKQKYLRVGNGAALVTKPQTGEILAMVGSTDYFDLAHDGNVNVTIANRSPGSSIKPLNYALAFERNLLTPSTILDDSPVVYRLAGSPPYAPGNYDSKFHGKVAARVALASSYNIPAVKVLEKNGVQNFIDFAQKLGLTTLSDPSRYGLSLTLGGGEIKMTDMAIAFSAFANSGDKVNLTPVLKVTDYRGNVLETSDQSQVTSDRVLSSQTAFLISNILSDDSARAPAFGRGSALNIPGHTVAVKTGTAETKRDNWTIGYTPSFLVAVWVGNNDNSPMSPFLESGNTGAAAIWNPIMSLVLKDQPNETFTPPENVIAVQVCALNGLLPCANCPSLRTDYFIKGTEPKIACKITQEDLDKMKQEQEKKENKPN